MWIRLITVFPSEDRLSPREILDKTNTSHRSLRRTAAQVRQVVHAQTLGDGMLAPLLDRGMCRWPRGTSAMPAATGFK